jgi:hypothetical protein
MVATPPTDYLVALAGLIQAQLNLQPDQVVIYNQQWVLPTDRNLYIVLEPRDSTPYGSSKRHECNSDGYTEVQTQNVREAVSIMLFSASDISRWARNQILFALNSDAAENLQEDLGFQIANLPTSFQNVSEVEATQRLSRYDLDFHILVAYTRRLTTPYFEKFTLPPEIVVNP